MLSLTHIVTLFSYGFLYLTVITLWFPPKNRLQLWHVLLFIAITLGLLGQTLKPISLLPIILLPIAIYYQSAKTPLYVNILSFTFIILLSVGLAAHLFPGFNNYKVFNQVYLSQNAVPFTLHLNFDKTLIGIFILGMGHTLITRSQDWIKLFKVSSLQMLITISLIILLTLLLGFVHFDPKLPNYFLVWAITNLLFVSVAEEAFFRGFLQQKLAQAMQKIAFGNYLAIFFASLLFGVAHYAGGIKYMLLASIAGIGYGLIYDRTKRIEASIITHFSLNLTHFLLFTYPMLNN